MLGALEAFEQYALFRQNDQRVITLLRLTQTAAQFVELGDILLQCLGVTVEQQAHGQCAQAQHVLTHLTDRHHAWQPVVVDFIGLRTHVRHLQQGERAKGEHHQGQ